MKTVLCIHSVSKKFKIRHQETKSYLTLSDELKSLFRQRITREEFYALQDISFDVAEGESIGIIGKNGAGKSTLLKILSRITPPSSGRIQYNGRIASLLEVGTGFHPELTGRENIFLNGAIMGMKKKEIQLRFDEIVSFSGVDKFLDTPLKHYSSGMQLRLAFSVAAHLEPEILIIDEVLAVGDAEFQKKCMGKMESVAGSGKTILFVSHNLAALNSLCTKSVLLEKGKMVASGNTSEVIDRYLNMNYQANTGTEKGVIEIPPAVSGGIIKRIKMFNEGILSGHFTSGRKSEIIIECESEKEIPNPVIGIVISDHFGTDIMGINNKHYGIPLPSLNGKTSFRISLHKLPLTAGNYKLSLFLGNGIADIVSIADAATFHVEALDVSGSGILPLERINRIFTPDVFWEKISN
ncbi:MAG: ABC transporter ATP-binding protein [Bacteroidia bacterium]|nr:ABC transporter ATP-binding protein [Bacteroidia bacterium]